MKKQLLELLALERIKESKVLLDAQSNSGAYYLAGYCVELSLKACIVKKVTQYEMPPKIFFNDFYVHDLTKLVKVAELEQLLKAKVKADLDFAINWNIVKDWNEAARNEQWTFNEANGLYDAFTNTRGGILPWIQQYW